MSSFHSKPKPARVSLPTRRRMLLSVIAAGGIRLGATEPKPATPAYNNMTDEQEISVGRDIAKSLEKDDKLKFIDEPGIHSYFNGEFQKIAKTSRRPNMPYSIKIVDTKSVNAFALPGGFVYLYRGLIESSGNECEVMGALAHEIGHVVGRHGANSLCRAKAADSLLSEASRVLLGDEGPAHILEQLGGPVAALALLKYDRQQELEADLLGFYNVQRAGWSPKGMVNMFKRFDDSSTPIDSVMNFTSDHPTPAEREDQILSEMKQSPPAENLKVDSDGFRQALAALKKLPPPPAKTSLNLREFSKQG